MISGEHKPRSRTVSTVTLLGCEVVGCSEKAIKVAWDDGTDVHAQWVPRSVCDDGDALDEGDTDICVAKWFVDKEGLPY